MQPTNDQNLQQNPSNPLPEGSVMRKAQLPSKRLAQSVVKQTWSHPLGKVFIIGGGSVTLLIAAGGLFRLLAWVRKGYKDYEDAGR
jgi:hypothetical protein